MKKYINIIYEKIYFNRKRHKKLNYLNNPMAHKPLTLKLLRDYNVYIDTCLIKLLPDENQVFTPEYLRDANIEAHIIVKIVYTYLKINGKEYEGRLLLAEIIEPASIIYDQYNPTGPNLVRDIMNLLKEKTMDNKKLSAALSAVRGKAWGTWSAVRGGWDAGKSALSAAESAALSAAESAVRDAAQSAWDAALGAAQSAWGAAESAALGAALGALSAAESEQIKVSIKFFNLSVKLEMKKTVSFSEEPEKVGTLLEIRNQLSEIISILKNKL